MHKAGIVLLAVALFAASVYAGDGRILRPRGGEVLVRGMQTTLEWSLTGVPVAAELRLVLVRDVGAERQRVGVIASGISAGRTQHPWLAGIVEGSSRIAPAGDGYRIKLRVENDGTTIFSDPFVLADRADRPGGEAAFIDLETQRVYVSGNKVTAVVANRGNRAVNAPRVPFSIWINSESGPPTIVLRRSLNIPAGGSAAIQLLPVNPEWCPTCCGVPVSVAVNRGDDALAEGNTGNNSKLERLYLKRRDWRMLPRILLGTPGGGRRIINSRTDNVVISPDIGRVSGTWGQGAQFASTASFQIKNCGNYGPSSWDPSIHQGAQHPILTVQVSQKGVWETVQVRGADGIMRPQTRFNPGKIRFAGGWSFSARIPIGQDAPLDIPITLIHPGNNPSALIFQFKDFRREDWGIFGFTRTSEGVTFSQQRLEFPLEFR